MAVTSSHCPNCHQPVPADARSCPHCGVYLRLPGQAETLLGVSQAASLASSKPALSDAVKQIDTVATTSIIISGVLMAFYAGAIFAGKVQAIFALNAIIYTLPVIALLVTIVLSVQVFSSSGYLTDDYPSLLKKKEERLRHSSLALEIAVALLAISVFVYLLRPLS